MTNKTKVVYVSMISKQPISILQIPVTIIACRSMTEAVIVRDNYSRVKGISNIKIIYSIPMYNFDLYSISIIPFDLIPEYRVVNSFNKKDN